HRDGVLEGSQCGASTGPLDADRAELSDHRPGKPALEPLAGEVLRLRPKRDLPGQHRPEEDFVSDREMIPGEDHAARGRNVLQPFNLGPPTEHQDVPEGDLADPIEQLHGSSDDGWGMMGGCHRSGHPPNQGHRARFTVTYTRSPSPTSPSKPLGGPSKEIDSASTSRATKSALARTASTTSGPAESATVIRSEMLRSAARRACCTTRTTSRASPSATSSGVTVVSSTTTPALPGSGADRSASAATIRNSYSPSRSVTPAATGAPSTSDHSPALTALITAWTWPPIRGPRTRGTTVSTCSQ